MGNTPATTNANNPQKVLKQSNPSMEATLNITKLASGTELENVLQGVASFTKCFPGEDKYLVSIKVEKESID